jgi:hypothetical protein
MSKYQDDVSIDQHDLERELVRQASLYLKYSELAVDANFERDKIKENIKVTESDIDLEIRQNFEQFGFDSKPTETAIRACILQQHEYRDIMGQYIKATKTFNSLTGAKTALEHKKKALELLVALIVRGYSAEPKVDPNIKYSRQVNAHKEMSEKLAKNARIK